MPARRIAPVWRPWEWRFGNWAFFLLALSFMFVGAYDIDVRGTGVTTIRRQWGGETTCYLTASSGWAGCDGSTGELTGVAALLLATAYLVGIGYGDSSRR